MRNANRIVFGKHEGDRLLEKPRRSPEDNINMDVEGPGHEGVD
jgi:hypothetical protein